LTNTTSPIVIAPDKTAWADNIITVVRPTEKIALCPKLRKESEVAVCTAAIS